MRRWIWLALATMTGCAVAPAPLLTLPPGHPGHADSGAAPFTPPPNPFQGDVAPPPEKSGGHEHHGEASKDYPLDVCVVSGEKLGSMGTPVILKHHGREVRLCCPNCIDDFKKEPEKYLKKLDEAEQKKKDEKKSEPKDEHEHHGGHP